MAWCARVKSTQRADKLKQAITVGGAMRAHTHKRAEPQRDALESKQPSLNKALPHWLVGRGGQVG